MSSNVRFATLDGMRGLAAIIVAAGHISEALGLGLPPHVHLAVDFFFVLSGFVIAQAYEARLATSMSLHEFIMIRALRLHPLMLLGSGISAGILIVNSLSGSGPGLAAILWTVVAATLVIPFHPLPSPRAFPLDGPAWSLFAEYWVNILFALVAPSLTPRRLQGLLIVGIAMLLILFSIAGGVGNPWRSDAIGLSILRVVYPFFAGVLLNRIHRGGKVRLPKSPPLLSVLVLGVILLSPASRFDAALQFAIITVVFPGLVLASTHDGMGSAQRRLMMLGGALSYPIYVLHIPLALLLVVPPVGLVVPAAWSKEALVLFMCGLVAISHLAVRYFDEPLRSWLGARFRSREARPVPA